MIKWILGQTLFTVNEPWLDEYREGTRSGDFQELQYQVENAFSEVISEMYADDNDYAGKATLIRVE